MILINVSVHNNGDADYAVCTLSIASDEHQCDLIDHTSNTVIQDIDRLQQYHYDLCHHALDEKHI